MLTQVQILSLASPIMSNKKIYLLILILTIIIALNYNWLDSKLQGFVIQKNLEKVQITRIVDGDTVDSSIGKIRLLGMNTPETTTHEEYSEEAKKYLKSKIDYKTVELKYGKNKQDRYGRTLAYIYFNNEEINLDLVKEGLANFYFPQGKDMHYPDYKQAWENCITKNENLCEKSTDKCSNCIKLKNLDINSQEVIFENICNFDCNLANWDIKDEGRKHFKFPEFILKKDSEIKIKVGENKNTEDTLYWSGHSYIWTRTGDTLFLRDSDNRLILWNSY